MAVHAVYLVKASPWVVSSQGWSADLAAHTVLDGAFALSQNTVRFVSQGTINTVQGGLWCTGRQEESHSAACPEPFPAAKQQQLCHYALPHVCFPFCRVSTCTAPELLRCISIPCSVQCNEAVTVLALFPLGVLDSLTSAPIHCCHFECSPCCCSSGLVLATGTYDADNKSARGQRLSSQHMLESNVTITLLLIFS